MNEFQTILYEIDAGRARITLNRPEKLNALSFELQRELNDALGLRDCSLEQKMYFADQTDLFGLPVRTPGCIRA